MAQELKINPWLKIWTRPRETIRAIVQSNTRHALPLLYWLYGLPLTGVFALAFLGRVPTFALVSGVVVLAFLVGWLGINVPAALFYWTGKWIKGVGTFSTVRAAVAWSTIPAIVGTFLQLILFWVFGAQMMMQGTQPEHISSTAVGFFLLASLVQYVLFFWGFVILLLALGSVQRFGVLKALLNVFLPPVVIMIGVSVILWLVSLFH